MQIGYLCSPLCLVLLAPQLAAKQGVSQGVQARAPLPAFVDMVRFEVKINDLHGGLQGDLDDFDVFGCAVSAIGDLDGDGRAEIAVGAYNDDDGGQDRGAVWILFLDAAGVVRGEQKISETAGGFIPSLSDRDYFGSATEGIGDLDGDGIPDLAVGARRDDGGAVYVLFLRADGMVRSQQRIGQGTGGFSASLDADDAFGTCVAALGDLDGDGYTELAVGDYLDDDGGKDRGAVWILSMNPDGSVRSHSKISSTSGGFSGTLLDNFWFGRSLAYLGDLDGDGVGELAVGQSRDEPDGADTRVGSVWILFLRPDGTVKGHQKISRVDGGFRGTVLAGDEFGNAVRAVGDLNGDGTVELVVGAWGDKDGGANRGALWFLFLRPDGTVQFHRKLSTTQGGFQGDVRDHDYFGTAIAAPGDLNGDGAVDLVVTALADDEGGTDRGAAWVLLLDGRFTGASSPLGLLGRRLRAALLAFGPG